MEERAFAAFPLDSLVQSPGVWRAIELYQGPSAVETVGLVSALSGPLAVAEIEMLVLSTFETDLVLVCTMPCFVAAASPPFLCTAHFSDLQLFAGARRALERRFCLSLAKPQSLDS